MREVGVKLALTSLILFSPSSHVLSHTSPTHSRSVLVKTDVVSTKRVPSLAVCSSLMPRSLNYRIVSTELINRSSYRLQMEEIDTKFDSTKVVNFQPYWNWSTMEKLPTKSVSKLYFPILNAHATIRRITFFIFKCASCPNPMLVSNFCVVPEALFRSPPKISGSFRSLRRGHNSIIYPPFTYVNGGVPNRV